jgi:Iron-containing alcohol dehydrogenase
MSMLSRLAGSGIVIAPTPTAHFGAGAVGKLPGIVRGLGGAAVVVVTDVVLTATPVVARVAGVLEAAGLPVTVFSGVHPNPTTGDLAAGAETAAAARAGASRPDEAGWRWWRWEAGRRSTRPRGSRSPPSTRSGGGTWTTAASSRARRCPSWRSRRPPAPVRRLMRSG